MSEQRQPAHWTWDAYVAWQATQPNRHELVDGEVHAMGGGTAAHDRIANTLRFAPTARLPQGAACRLHGPDMMPRTGTGNARYPDALIDCGPCVPEALQAQEPVAVFEDSCVARGGSISARSCVITTRPRASGIMFSFHRTSRESWYMCATIMGGSTSGTRFCWRIPRPRSISQVSGSRSR